MFLCKAGTRSVALIPLAFYERKSNHSSVTLVPGLVRNDLYITRLHWATRRLKNQILVHFVLSEKYESPKDAKIPRCFCIAKPGSVMEALPIDILSHDTWLKCVYRWLRA